MYIHGHSAGGTNPSLVEMMHFAKPVIAFDCSYNRASMEGLGYYFTDADQLKEIIGDVNNCSDQSMRDIAQRRYRHHQRYEREAKSIPVSAYAAITKQRSAYR